MRVDACALSDGLAKMGVGRVTVPHCTDLEVPVIDKCQT